MVTKKTWDDFRASGLLWFINTFLHAFGWAIVVDVDTETKKVTDSYPARVKFRGFDYDSMDEGYLRVSKLMESTGSELVKEVEDGMGEPGMWLCGRFVKETDDGNIWDFQGTFYNRKRAVEACKDSHYFIFPVNPNEELSKETSAPPGIEYPLTDVQEN